MLKKWVGYLFAFLGLLIIVLGMFGSSFGVNLDMVSDLFLYGIAGVFLIIGVLITVMDKGSGKVETASEEVPIYQGKKIVGYRKSE